jgi:hypothetical protein
MKRSSFLAAAAALPGLPYMFSGHPSAAETAMLMEAMAVKPGEPGYQALHPDAQTDFTSTDYYFLGNGKVCVALQHAFGKAAEAGMTPLGLMFWNPAQFARKWSTYMFHPEWGLRRGMVSVVVDGTVYQAAADAIKVERTYIDGIPTVEVTWPAGPHTMVERLWVDADSPLLLRELELKNGGSGEVDVRFNSSLYYNHILFTDYRSDKKNNVLRADGYAHMELYTDPPAILSDRFFHTEAGKASVGGSARSTIYYCVNTTKEEVATVSDTVRRHRSRRMWGGTNQIETDNPAYNKLYAASRDNIRAVVAEDGRYDASIWQYNMEWTIDAAHVAMGATETGMYDVAAAMLNNIVTRLSNENGVMAHSSRFRENLETELNQQGAILGSLWTYWAWTGDLNLIRKLWPQIVKIAEMPLKQPYMHESGMLYAGIEFFERDQHMGIVAGFDLSHQAYVSWGLQKAAILAREIGDTQSASKWDAAGKRMFDAMMNHPTLKMVEDGMFIKRRLPDGTRQRVMKPREVGTDHVPLDSPLAHEGQPLLDPDISLLHPAMLKLIDIKDPIVAKTIASVKTLWDDKMYGGYLRYHPSSEPDSPGGWTFPTAKVAKVMAEFGDTADVKRVLDWFTTVPGHNGAAYPEFYALTPRPVPPLPPMGVIVWGWGEIVGLFVSNVLGARPDTSGRNLLMRPTLPDGVNKVNGTVMHRGREIRVTVERGRSSGTWNGRALAKDGDAWKLPDEVRGGDVVIRV